MERTAPRSTIKPILKWAGGKSQLLPHLLAAYDFALGGAEHYFFEYHEPFVGSGALFFALSTPPVRFSRAHLNDNNADLINLYQTLTSDWEGIVQQLEPLEREYNVDRDHQRRSELYYAKRTEYNNLRNKTGLDGNTRTAALMLFLNRTTFNGLYRVNRSGEFNVPHGRYSFPRICNEEALETAAQALSLAHLTGDDFEVAAERVKGPGHFVYFDPPYFPVSKTSSFTAYTDGEFGAQEQERLASVFAELDERGARVVLSNSHTPYTVELYQEVGAQLYQVPARRPISSKLETRGPVTELIVANFKVPALEPYRLGSRAGLSQLSLPLEPVGDQPDQDTCSTA